MGMMDSVKDAIKGKSGKVAEVVDTAVEKVDERTGGKYRDKLTSGAGKLKVTVRKLDADAAPDDSGGAGAGDPGPSDPDTARPS